MRPDRSTVNPQVVGTTVTNLLRHAERCARLTAQPITIEYDGIHTTITLYACEDSGADSQVRVMLVGDEAVAAEYRRWSEAADGMTGWKVMAGGLRLAQPEEVA